MPTRIPDPEPPYDPHGRGASILTEVRTVLSRAETALETITHTESGHALRVVRDGYWNYDDPAHPYHVPAEVEPHPDGEAIVAALQATIAALEPWRGPSKRRGPR